ncbi:MAG: translation initiation factor IF-2 N-terminal domain-containing protein, partial [Chloroflexota bacterium]|nr:translation initiation factor IF-2 N-terminal domain-containing protein [Chloroflexota bacterium]
MANTFQSRGAGTRRGPSRGGPGGRRGKGRGGTGARTVAVRRAMPAVREPVALPSVMSVAELADALETTGIDVIKELMKLGIMANLNQQI